MLDDLQTIADTLDLAFYYGESQALNIKADAVRDDQLVLFHEGYVAGQITESQQGAFEPVYSLKLWLLIPSKLSDNPDQRKPRFMQLNALMLTRLLPAIERNYELSSISIVEGLNLKDRNLDGLRVTLTAKPRVTAAYC